MAWHSACRPTGAPSELVTHVMSARSGNGRPVRSLRRAFVACSCGPCRSSKGRFMYRVCHEVERNVRARNRTLTQPRPTEAGSGSAWLTQPLVRPGCACTHSKSQMRLASLPWQADDRERKLLQPPKAERTASTRTDCNGRIISFLIDLLTCIVNPPVVDLTFSSAWPARFRAAVAGARVFVSVAKRE